MCLKKVFLLVLIVSSLNLLNGCGIKCTLKNNDLNNQKHLRVINYNVLEGFINDLDRETKVAQWLNEKDPDVIAFEELNEFTEDYLKDLAQSWGHKYVVMLKTDGYPTGLTSKKPITDIKRILTGMHHGLLQCKTGGINYFVVHLSPFDYKLRQSEAGIILKEVKALLEKGEQSIVLGDFNSLSAIDAQYYKKNNTVEHFRTQDEKRKLNNLNNGELDFTVLKMFEDAGLTDVVKKYYKDKQTQVSYGTSLILNLDEPEDVQRRIRIDYIMVSPGLAAESQFAYVENDNNITGDLSDHYPVIADFNLQ
ncbi:MAG: hypothetical protein A2252_01950 [Elusimicrobia bacterium RIFOXYA2_FULL_39_19]|nr:MAG: hypothetical protein A2252_01950 [Elusimicrobia bacterium RIFOXYA2_FULL_39_19]